MHYVGVVFTGEDITSATHVCRKLIDLIEAAINYGATKPLVPQIADHEIVGFGLRKFVKFQIYAAHPKSVILQPLDKMAADEATFLAGESKFHHQSLFHLLGAIIEKRSKLDVVKGPNAPNQLRNLSRPDGAPTNTVMSEFSRQCRRSKFVGRCRVNESRFKVYISNG